MADGQVDAQDTSEGDSNRNMFLLHLAGLAVQRDSPLRPANAHRNSSRPPSSNDASNQSNQEQNNQEQDGWETPPASDYEPDQLQHSRLILLPMPNHAAFRREGMFQDLPCLIPHDQTRMVVSTLMPGLVNEFFHKITGNLFE